MAHALVLAARGNGCVWPNPSVGCVIVQGSRIVGRGFTQPGGRPHAEVMALAQAGEAAQGATVYVTLEPCAHHGQTPPCADALIAARVARVVTALTDPDPRVAGKGHAMLRSAGIAVTEGVMAERARDVTAGFLKRVTHGLPFVTLKLAATLDGRTATAAGESRWITGPDARRMVHAMRLSHDAVMIGAGTALADDPDLTARDIGAAHQPIRIVMDSSLRTPLTSRLARTAHESPVWMIHTDAALHDNRRAWERAGARLIHAGDAITALRALADAGLTRILCEGGATLAASLLRGSLLRGGLVDELALFTAGAAFGADGHPAIGSIGLTALKDAPRMTLRDQRRVGGDMFSLWAAR